MSYYPLLRVNRNIIMEVEMCIRDRFDIAPSDCLASLIRQRATDPNSLILAVIPKGTRPSHGTLKTALRTLGHHPVARRSGGIVPCIATEANHQIVLNGKNIPCVRAPLPDLFCAHLSTGIENIDTYLAMPRHLQKMAKIMPVFRKLKKLPWFNNIFGTLIELLPNGPSEEQQKNGRAFIYAKIENRNGNTETAIMTTLEPYAYTGDLIVSATKCWLEKGMGLSLIHIFDNEIMAFFSSLPSAIYLSGSQDKKEVIRISFFSRTKLAYDENKLNPLFLEQSSQLKVINVKDQRPSKDKIDIRASIETEEWRRSRRIKNGIGLLDQDRGATTWAVLSSPTLVNRYYLDFHQDAFAAIDINQLVRDATITNIHRDIRKSKNYSVEDSLNLATGRPAHEAIPVSIKIASTMSLVRGVPTTGKQMKSGLNARMNEYNRSLQAAQRNIRLYVDNDNYNPQFARKNIQKFLDLGINFFIIPVGTPTLYSYLDLIEKNQAVVFFPNTGASSLRAPKFTDLIHFRASYDDEARVLIRELKHQYGANKFAFFYQDDAFGKEPLKAAVLELEKLGIKDYLALPYTRGSVNFANQARAIKLFSPNALGFFAVATATKEFIRQMGVNDLLSMNLFATSATGESQLRRFLKNKGLSILFGCFLPNPYIGDQPIARAYRDAMERDNNIMGIQSFEAYFATSLFIHALNQIASGAPRPQELLKVFERMKNTNFHGVDLNFNPATRSLAKDVYIENGDGKLWKKYQIDSLNP